MENRQLYKKNKTTAKAVAKYLIKINKEACQEKNEVARSIEQGMEQEEIETGMSKLKLQKLLYYCQGYHLAIHGKPMFEDKIEAWQHGPVVPEVYREFKGVQGNFISPDKEGKLQQEDLKQIDQEKQHVIEEVFDLLGHYDAWKLRNKTHEEKPWIKAQEKAEKEQKTNVVIENKDMKEYFSQYVKEEE